MHVYYILYIYISQHVTRIVILHVAMPTTEAKACAAVTEVKWIPTELMSDSLENETTPTSEDVLMEEKMCWC